MAKETAFDPLAVLANDVFTQPGVFALILGSGVSTGAGVPTGWQVVKKLVQRIAAASTPDDPDAWEAAAADPESWWHHHSEEPLGYSNLLSALARTPASRRAQIAGFFEATDEQLENGEKVPSQAHRAIARLIKAGFIKLVITTNFDRLLEQALDAESVMYQVVSRVGDVKGMEPLSHASATIIKINGDWADLNMRNTVDELATYPAPLARLLRQALDEFGLIVSGWSADWDTALLASLNSVSQRRYPLFWDSRSAKGQKPRAILAGHRGVVVPAASADEMFVGIADRVEAIARLSEPPLSTEIAVQRLKRYVLDPERRIDLSDLVLNSVDTAVREAQQVPLIWEEGVPFAEYVDQYTRLSLPSVQLLSAGVFYDLDRKHGQLWVDALQRLLNANNFRTGQFNEILLPLRHLPALLALRAMSITAVARRNDALMLRLLTEPKRSSPFRNNGTVRALHVLHPGLVLDRDSVATMPIPPGTSRGSWPTSTWLEVTLRDSLSPFFGTVAEIAELSNTVEYRWAFAQHLSPEGSDWAPAEGQFLQGFRFGPADEKPYEEAKLMAEIASDPRNPWRRLFNPDDQGESVLEFRKYLHELARSFR